MIQGDDGIRQASNAGIVIVSCYIAAQILSDIGSLKIALIGNLSMDAGTLIYPITFTLRDLIHKRLGKRAARLTVLLAGGINLFMAFFLWFSSLLPEDPSWGLGPQFAAVLGPVWRIVAASIVAEVVSELLDTEMYHLWTTRVTTRRQWSRVLVSNAVSVPVDSLVFCWGAFAFSLPNRVVWSIVLSNVVVKMIVTIISVPAIYLVKERAAD